MQAAREEKLASRKADSMNRMMADLAVDRQRNPEAVANDRWDAEDEEEAEDGDGSDNDIIDRCEFKETSRTSPDLYTDSS